MTSQTRFSSGAARLLGLLHLADHEHASPLDTPTNNLVANLPRELGLRT